MNHVRFRKAGLMLCFAFTIFCLAFSSCGIYKFNQAIVDPRIKSAKIQLIENVAPYVNPQLTPTLTDRLRQKLNNQTKLSLTNSDNANLIIGGQIIDYSVSTSGVTSNDGRSQASINRLTVSVKITMTNQVDEKGSKDVTVTRQFDFPATQSLQQAEATLLDEMVRNLTDEIFNQLFSNW